VKYFTPETSKKLEEMGLKRHQDVIQAVVDDSVETKEDILMKRYNSLDICELENAKKLWGDAPSQDWFEINEQPPYYPQIQVYITLSDEERVQYVEDTLKTVDYKEALTQPPTPLTNDKE
jgi:hypothetical protein